MYTRDLDESIHVSESIDIIVNGPVYQEVQDNLSKRRILKAW